MSHLFIPTYATSQTQACKELKVPLRLATGRGLLNEHPVDVRLATTEVERRPNPPPLGAELAKGPNGSFREAKSCPVALQRGI